MPSVSGYSSISPALPTGEDWSGYEFGPVAVVLVSTGTDLNDNGNNNDKDSNQFQVVCVP